MQIISIIVIPLFILMVIIYGYRKGMNVYDSFLEGAKEGMVIVFNICPAVLAMVFAVNIFMDSQVLGFLLNPISKLLAFPSEILPMAFLRPISGSASMAIATDIMKKYDVNSKIGFIVLMVIKKR